MFVRNLAICAALAVSVPAGLTAQSEISEEDAAALQGAVDRGQAIYRYDQAAWHTTDAMLADIADPQGEGIRGWIINEVDDGLEAVFYRPSDDGFEAVWSATYNGEKVRNKTTYKPGERALSPMEVSKAKASKVPLSEELQRCSEKPFNTVVFPSGDDDGSLYVYYLVPQETLDAVPLGGHYRFRVRDGKVVDSRKFSNSCLSLRTVSQDGGDKPVGLIVTHLLDPVPTEIHVFSTLAARIPIYVSTTENEQLWINEIVEGQVRITKSERKSK